MSGIQIATLLITLAAAAVLISGKLKPDLTALAVLVVLGLSRIVTPAEAFAGFGGTVVMTLLGISILSESLHQTGITQTIGAWMHRIGGRSERLLIAAALLVSAGLSLFMHNIAAVGVLLPAVMSLSRRSQVSPSRLLMPLAFGTTLGGMATLFTTANIILSSTLRDNGYAPLQFFDFFKIGAPLIFLGLIYMLTLGRRLLPSDQTAVHPQDSLAARLAGLYGIEQDLIQLRVLDHSPFSGLSLAEGKLAARTGLTVVAIKHGETTVLAPNPGEVLHAGDLITAHGICAPADLTLLGLALVEHAPNASAISDENINLVEIILPPQSSLIGRTIKDLAFRDNYGLNVLALWRAGKPIPCTLGDERLQSGDALLVQGPAHRIHHLNNDSDLIVTEKDPDAVLNPHKAALAGAITIITLGVASFTNLPTSIVVFSGAVLVLLTGCLSLNDAYSSIEWKVIFLIAGMWPLSTAIRTTGLADLAIHSIFAQTGVIPPLAATAVFLALAFGFTQIMTGQVAALVLAPLALSAAAPLGLDPRPLALAVALGCSLAFATPYGHPVNLMVMVPAGYTTRDFLKIGLPLTLLVAAAILCGLHWIWGV